MSRSTSRIPSSSSTTRIGLACPSFDGIGPGPVRCRDGPDRSGRPLEHPAYREAGLDGGAEAEGQATAEFALRAEADRRRDLDVPGVHAGPDQERRGDAPERADRAIVDLVPDPGERDVDPR